MDYDAELRLHAEVLRRARAIRASEHVLDIGCGTGQTTRDAGRAASAGSALGIDTSAPMIARARELAAAEHLDNVRFEHDDAQVHAFPAQNFDVAISRFGTMFFADPVAAFRNIHAALKDDGRLVMIHPRWKRFSTPLDSRRRASRTCASPCTTVTASRLRSNGSDDFRSRARCCNQAGAFAR